MMIQKHLPRLEYVTNKPYRKKLMFAYTAPNEDRGADSETAPLFVVAFVETPLTLYVRVL